jgi:farnesyl-diphosphate farnesyltransferase
MSIIQRISRIISQIFNLTHTIADQTENAMKVCWDNLAKVSRSFALVIQNLPEGLDKQVMIGYEILRTVDTIEDSQLPDSERKVAFDLFRNILGGKADQNDVLKLQQIIDSGVHTTLDKTVAHVIVPHIFTALSALGPEQQEIIKRTAMEMSLGMEREDFRDVKDLDHNDEYCHYVAGIVGIMLTDLFEADGRLTKEQYEKIQPYSEPYGLGLQKVNILKDMYGDIKEGRFFWPRDLIEKYGFTKENILEEAKDRPEEAQALVNELVEDTRKQLNSGVEYVTLLPEHEKKVRMFSAIPLYMAIATAGRMHNTLDVFFNAPVKIPRSQTYAIVNKLDTIIQDNDALREYYESFFHSGS